MKPLRKYGSDPFRVVVVHGGPGAPGSVAPIARTLGQTRGVLEPFQTAPTLDGQIEELRLVVERHGTMPIVFIGHSWGAWLSALVTAAYPDLVRKLILVGSGPFEEDYVPLIEKNRFKRLSLPEQAEYIHLVDQLERAATPGSTASLARLGELSDKADSYDPLALPNDTPDLEGMVNPAQVYRDVWSKAAELRATGELLRRVATISCPVVALHGDYDPHPAEGIQQPLAARVNDFRLILLENCGHTPWGERLARETFYELLEHELSSIL
ncbi:MAG TPA: alpha/beta hydrolase [Ktedonobacteraceae bacterium]|nr:alpha/beta hydrolase [Ktedonobacteraceae bacterium]